MSSSLSSYLLSSFLPRPSNARWFMPSLLHSPPLPRAVHPCSINQSLLRSCCESVSQTSLPVDSLKRMRKGKGGSVTYERTGLDREMKEHEGKGTGVWLNPTKKGRHIASFDRSRLNLCECVRVTFGSRGNLDGRRLDHASEHCIEWFRRGWCVRLPCFI